MRAQDVRQVRVSLGQLDQQLEQLRQAGATAALLADEETARELGSTRMKVRTAEGRLRNRLRAFLRDSGYLDAYPRSRPAPAPMDHEPTRSGSSILDDHAALATHDES